MLRYPVILILLVIELYVCNAQEYIGKHKDEVKQIMGIVRKDVYIDPSSRNTVYNLLKYVDRNSTQTILFVFDDHDTCKYYKSFYDYSYLRKVEKELNQKYTRSGSGNWYFIEDHNKYLVTLKKEKWYFSVLVKNMDE
jgi:hypothetical protein